MGDRYTIKIRCASCNFLNEHYHAESCGSHSFHCEKCEKINWVSIGFVAKIVSPEEEKRLYKEEGFE